MKPSLLLEQRRTQIKLWGMVEGGHDVDRPYTSASFQCQHIFVVGQWRVTFHKAVNIKLYFMTLSTFYDIWFLSPVDNIQIL